MIDKWIYQMVADIVAYEEVHPSPKSGGICLDKTLALIPDDVKTVARAMVDSSLDDHHKYVYGLGEDDD